MTAAIFFVALCKNLESSAQDKQALLDRIMPPMVEATRTHPTRMGFYCTLFIHETLNYPEPVFAYQAFVVDDWNTRLLDSVVESGAIEVLLDMAHDMEPFNATYDIEDPGDEPQIWQDVLMAMPFYLTYQPTHPRRSDLLPRLRRAVDSISRELLAGGRGVEDSVEEYDDDDDDDDNWHWL